MLSFITKIWFMMTIVSVLHGFHNYPLLSKNFDGLIVFTGRKHRIQEGLDLLEQNYSHKLYISGVKIPYKKNHPQIVQGYKAKNTKGNIRELNEWIEKYKIKNCLIITHDYHIPRIRVLYTMLESPTETDIMFYSITEKISLYELWVRLLESQKFIYTIGEFLIKNIKKLL